MGRDRSGGARPPGPPDAARREAPLRGLHHRYIRLARGYRSPGPRTLPAAETGDSMKLRPIFLALLLIGGFVYFTTTRWSPLHIPAPARWWTPAAAEPTGLPPEETSNIAISRAASPATVFITSVVYQRDCFFQVYPVRESGYTWKNQSRW